MRVLPTRDAPPARLHGAMHDAVFPGGRRARPLLCRLVADSYGGGDDEMVGRLAAAIELVHCASLVQDDLPCFDDAETPPRAARLSRRLRRGDRHPRRRRAADAGVRDAGQRSGAARAGRLPLDGPAHRGDRQLARRHRRPGARARAASRSSSRSTTATRRPRCSAPPPPVGRSAAAPRTTSRAGRASASSSAARCSCATTWKTSAAPPTSIGKPTGRDAALGRPNAAHASGHRELSAEARRCHRRGARAARSADAGERGAPPPGRRSHASRRSPSRLNQRARFASSLLARRAPGSRRSRCPRLVSTSCGKGEISESSPLPACSARGFRHCRGD